MIQEGMLESEPSIELSEIQFIFADGDANNVQVINQHLSALNFRARSRICYNGKDLVECFEKVVNKAL